ncbi:hypothetical protein [Leptospira interrogans]|uniref:hypothetical protein n=1 Tax=Leptospira interrogans TaxID=173 RepID=UPI0004AC3FD4|nr:hypothetical protein [Leptospira interrogans]
MFVRREKTKLIIFDQLFRLLTNFEVKTLGKGATDETIKFAEEKLEIIGISEFHYNYFLEIGKRVPVENKKYHLIHVHWRNVFRIS